MKPKIEHKLISGHITETKEGEVNGVRTGTVSGLLATWDLDRGDWMGVKDRFVRGAFTSTILDHLQKRRPIRMLYQHGNLIGGFPMEFIKESDEGLFGVGEINLETQEGREAFALAKQGVLSDFSVGFSVDEFEMDGEVRTITKATLWECSLVMEPMNPAAVVQQVKSVVPFQDLPLASQDREWDSDAAIARIREFTDSEDAPNSGYRIAFVWYDQENSENFGSYKLPIADVIDGRLMAVPRGIFAAAGALAGARGGVDIPAEDRDRAIAHIESYYEKMDLDSPFDDDEAGKQYYGIDDVKDWRERDVEKALRAGAKFSKSATKKLMAVIGGGSSDIEDDDSDGEKFDKILTELKGMKGLMKA